MGDLARLPLVAVAALPNFPKERQDAVRRHLARLAGRESAFESLDALDAALATDLGDRKYAAISAVVGLRGGTVRTFTEAGGHMGVSRPRVSQLAEIEELRLAGNTGYLLATLVEELLPAAGFASLDDVAEAIALRLPVRDPERVSALGYARLGALLLRADGRVAQAGEVRIVCRAPWTEDALDAMQSALGTAANWPPSPRGRVEVQLWDHVGDQVQRALVRWGADAGALLDGLLRLGSEVCVDRFGALYTPPVPVVDALRQLRPLAGPSASASAWLAEANATWEGISPPDDLDDALLRAGFRKDGAAWVDPARVEAAAPVLEPVVDATIPGSGPVRRPPWCGRWWRRRIGAACAWWRCHRGRRTVWDGASRSGSALSLGPSACASWTLIACCSTRSSRPTCGATWRRSSRSRTRTGAGSGPRRAARSTRR